MTNLFAGVGLQDKIAVMAEYVLSDKEGVREAKTASVDITLQAIPGLLYSREGKPAK